MKNLVFILVSNHDIMISWRFYSLLLSLCVHVTYTLIAPLFIFVDHYYAFEITFTEPKKVFEELLPEKYFPIYHWINTGERIIIYIIVCCISWGNLYYLLFFTYLCSVSLFFQGVSHEEGSKMNPLRSILSSFDEDDFIVIKLDIDTGSIEVPLVKQLLDGGENGIYHKLIDQFYFEHHVHMKEIAGSWGSSMRKCVYSTSFRT